MNGASLILVYLVIINAISFITAAYDKVSAKQHGMRRIPEKTLFALAVIGGSVGLYIAMLSLRHKTRHRKFMLGVPLILFSQLGLLVFLCLRP